MEGRLATMCGIKVKHLSRLFFVLKVGNEPSKVFCFFLNKTAKMMRGKGERKNSRSWREAKKSKGENTCPTSKEK